MSCSGERLPLDVGICRQRLKLIAYSLAIVLLVTAPSQAQIGEKELKAAFVLRVAEFVSWPKTTVPDPESELVVAVIGEVDFETELIALSRRTPSNGRPLKVRRLKPGESVAGCHVLFFGAMDRDDVTRALSQIQSDAILTVSESDDFARSGGVMNIRFERNEEPGARHGDIAIRFEINVATSKRVGLVISSRLLQVATIVRD